MKALLIVTAVLLLIGVGANSHFARRITKAEEVTANAIPPIDISSSLDQSDEVGPEVKHVLLALLPQGFEANELQLEAGEYVFIIGNRTGLKEVNVRLSREGEQRLAEARVGGRQRDWKKRFNLTAGTYIVTANDNPEWTCRIVVRQ
jgi:hypothetical protein